MHTLRLSVDLIQTMPRLLICPLIALLVWMAGCATPTANPPGQAPMRATPAASESPAPQADGLSPSLFFQIMAAEVAAQRGEAGKAFATLIEAARDTAEPKLARRAAQLAIEHNALAQALEAAELWHRLEPASSEAAHTLGALLIARAQYDEAYAVYAPWVLKDPKTHLHAVLGVLYQAPDPQAVFALLDRLTQRALNELPMADASKAQLHYFILAVPASRLGLKRAQQELLAAYTLQPDNELYATSAARQLASASRATGPAATAAREQARALLADFLKRNPAAQVARMQYAQLLAADEQLDAAVEQLNIVLERDPKHLNVLYDLSLLSIRKPPHTASRHYLERYLRVLATQPEAPNHQELAHRAYLLLARLAQDEGHHKEALQWILQIKAADANEAQRRLSFDAAIEHARILGDLGRIDEGLALLKALRADNNSDKARIALTQAALLTRADQDQQAYAVLSEALTHMPDDPDLLYDAAMAAERIDALEAVEKHLKHLITLKPDHAHAYNALGYTWADRNMRLQEADQLLKRALALAPDDPAIIDSAGWLQYRLGHLGEARALLARAFDIRPDADIGAHLGEVLWQLDQREQALNVWRSAQSLGPDNPTLMNTLKRLGVELTPQAAVPGH